MAGFVIDHQLLYISLFKRIPANIWAVKWFVIKQVVTSTILEVPEYIMLDKRWKLKSGSGNYTWMLNKTDLENGITNFGYHTRLRVALDKMSKGMSTHTPLWLLLWVFLRKVPLPHKVIHSFWSPFSGEKIKIVTIGGSITAGQGYDDAPNWPQWLQNYLEDNYGPDAAQGISALGLASCDVRDDGMLGRGRRGWHSKLPTFKITVWQNITYLLSCIHTPSVSNGAVPGTVSAYMVRGLEKKLKKSWVYVWYQGQVWCPSS